MLLKQAREDSPLLRGERSTLIALLVAAFVAGPTLAVIGLALPHPAETSDAGILALTGGAYAIAAVLWLSRRRLPDWGLDVALVCGSLLISASITLTATSVSTGAFFYLWIVLGAAYFFDRRRVAIQLIVVAVGFGVALALKPDEPGIVQAWIVAVGTLSIAAVAFVFMRERVNGLVARLARAAQTDPLTELLNRRGFARQLELELERAERTGGELSLIVGDLDRFKQINDRFGHQAGDQALVDAAAVLRRHARRIDCLARVGGEEFAILVPGADASGAFATAERLRFRIRESFAPTHPGLTISFGIASYPRDATSVARLMRCADQSLYAAKALGRDRSVIHSREVLGALASDSEDDASSVATTSLVPLLSLAEALDIRDPHTARHSETVGRYAEAAARELGLAAAHVERVRLAGILHDIGKVGVSDAILLKPGPPTEAEWEEIRMHPETAARLLGGAGFSDLRAWILAHHERLDGSGYPFGLSAEEIPLESRILAVADAFEAMTVDRAYRPARSASDAFAELERCAGTQFDAEVVAALGSALRADRGLPVALG